MCVCLDEEFWHSDVIVQCLIPLCVCVYVCLFVCVCVCACAGEGVGEHGGSSGLNPRRSNSLGSLSDPDCYMNSLWPRAATSSNQVPPNPRLRSNIVQC